MSDLIQKIINKAAERRLGPKNDLLKKLVDLLVKERAENKALRTDAISLFELSEMRKNVINGLKEKYKISDMDLVIEYANQDLGIRLKIQTNKIEWQKKYGQKITKKKKRS